jgi:hypothetical protein
MMGEQEATVVSVKPFGIHGLPYYDISVRFADQIVQQARLGAESIPDGIQPGDRVIATRVANMVVSIRRP